MQWHSWEKLRQKGLVMREGWYWAEIGEHPIYRTRRYGERIWIGWRSEVLEKGEWGRGVLSFVPFGVLNFLALFSTFLSANPYWKRWQMGGGLKRRILRKWTSGEGGHRGPEETWGCVGMGHHTLCLARWQNQNKIKFWNFLSWMFVW